jgi:hypothetical protein
MPPDFQLSIRETMQAVDRVLSRYDVRRVSDIRMGFDNELQLQGINPSVSK